MSTPVAGKPYARSWPLPGGANKYLDTLGDILEWIASHPNTEISQVQAWFRDVYNLKSIKMAAEYLDVPREMGYLGRTKTTISLTPAGKHYLHTKDKEFVLGGYLSECRGAWEVLNAVRRIGFADAAIVRRELQPQFPWASNSPLMWRLNWLLCLGCLEKLREGYTITPSGEQALQKYKGPGPSDSYRAPRILKEPEADPIPYIAGPAERPDITAERTTEADNRSTLVTPLDELINEIRRTALASDEATDFERALNKAFAYLGFQATHKSGPGDTDILIDASLGHDTYRAIIDGKSSKHGKISTAAVNWSALNKHRGTYNANYILVAAPGFSSGDLHNYARETGAALITAGDLCEILRLHYETPFSLIELRALFSDPGEPERPLQKMKERHNELSRLQQLIPETIDALARYGGEPISDEGLYYILRESHAKQQYKKREIQEALAFLESPFMGALRKVEEHTYVLEMTKETIMRRLQAQGRATERNI